MTQQVHQTTLAWRYDNTGEVVIRVELLPGFKFTPKIVKIMEVTGEIGKAGKW